MVSKVPLHSLSHFRIVNIEEGKRVTKFVKGELEVNLSVPYGLEDSIDRLLFISGVEYEIQTMPVPVTRYFDLYIRFTSLKKVKNVIQALNKLLIVETAVFPMYRIDPKCKEHFK